MHLIEKVWKLFSDTGIVYNLFPFRKKGKQLHFLKPSLFVTVLGHCAFNSAPDVGHYS